jgi:hypothetical protein
MKYPAGTWHAVFDMERSKLLVNVDEPLVGTLTEAGKWTPLRKDSQRWFTKEGYLDQLAPNPGDRFTRDDVAELLFTRHLSADRRAKFEEWREDNEVRNKLLNYGYRFVYFALHMGLVERAEDEHGEPIPHVYIRTSTMLGDLKVSPDSISPLDDDMAEDAELEEIFEEFKERVRALLSRRRAMARSSSIVLPQPQESVTP